MKTVKNAENVKRQLDEVDNMITILSDIVRRGMKIDPQTALERFAKIRQKLKYAQDNIQG
jgi:hypothetical protein